METGGEGQVAAGTPIRQTLLSPVRGEGVSEEDAINADGDK